jgi:hypothetical protein
MNKRCKHVRQDGFNCGSYAFNLYKDDIDQGDLCDVHYWQAKAQRTWVGGGDLEDSNAYQTPQAQPPQRKPLTEEQIWKAIRPLATTDKLCKRLIDLSMDEYRAIEAAHGIKENT